MAPVKKPSNAVKSAQAAVKAASKAVKATDKLVKAVKAAKSAKPPAASSLTPGAVRKPIHYPGALDDERRKRVPHTLVHKMTPKRVIGFCGERRSGASTCASVMPYALLSHWLAGPSELLMRNTLEDVAVFGAPSVTVADETTTFKSVLDSLGGEMVHVYAADHEGPMEEPYIHNNGTKAELLAKARALLEGMGVEVWG